MVEVHKDHDEICLDIVGRISELGGFKVEFPVYITCYEEKESVYYYVSNEKKDVYCFINQKLKEELYCLPPVRKTMTTIVSAGQKDELYQQFKVEAAKELMNEGAGEVVAMLPKLAPKPTNVGQELLEGIRIQTKGIFDQEMRQLYRGILDMAYYAKKINGNFYNKTLAWLNIEEMQQEEEIIAHALHERIYSGFAYVKHDEGLGYYFNAVLESTISKREELMIQGMMVSPILTKKYYFNDINAINNAARDFKGVLKKYLCKGVMEILKDILGENPDENDIDRKIRIAEEEKNEMKLKCLRYYKALWKIN